MATADYGMLSKFKGVGAALKDQQELDLKNQTAKQDALYKQAQINELNQKANYPDVDKIGENALYKAAQGIELSVPEQAAAKYVSAKSGVMQFDPTTGAMLQKPNIASQLGVNLGLPQSPQSAPQASPLPLDDNNEYDVNFKNVYQSAIGNPKLQQQLLTDYSKDKFNMNESQSKNAGFADRMIGAQGVLDDKDVTGAQESRLQRGLASVPFVGNSLVSKDYQVGNQAKEDFINATLRRESGAAISPSEFAKGDKQYFPQPGDSDAVITQKALNRQRTLEGVQRSAGAAYKKPVTADDLTSNPIDSGAYAPPDDTLDKNVRPNARMVGEASFAAQKAKVPFIATKAAFDKLPSGSIYMESDGKQYRKP